MQLKFARSAWKSKAGKLQHREVGGWFRAQTPPPRSSHLSNGNLPDPTITHNQIFKWHVLMLVGRDICLDKQQLPTLSGEPKCHLPEATLSVAAMCRDTYCKQGKSILSQVWSGAINRIVHTLNTHRIHQAHLLEKATVMQKGSANAIEHNSKLLNRSGDIFSPRCCATSSLQVPHADLGGCARDCIHNICGVLTLQLFDFSVVRVKENQNAQSQQDNRP